MIQNTPYKFYFISIAIFLLLASACLLLYINSRQVLNKERELQIQVSGSLAVHDFEGIVNNNISSLENLKERIEESEGKYFKYLKSESARIIEQNPAIKFIEWIDPNGIIRVIFPEEENTAVLNLDIKTLDWRYPEWLQKSRDTLVNITPWVKLTQKGKMFLVDVPLYYNNSFQGTISAGMDLKEPFDKLSTKLEKYSIIIQDELGTTFYLFNSKEEVKIKEEMIYKSSLNIDPVIDNNWFFQFMPHKDESLSRNTQHIALVVGILLSGLIALLAYFYLMAKRETLRYEITNNALKKMNEELEVQKEMANRASEAKTRFLSNMSHEIRTPLSAILGFAEILEGKNLTKEEMEYVTLMRHSSATLLNLVNNILEFDKIESGTMFLSKDRFSPRILIENIIKTYSEKIIDKNLKIEMDFDTETIPETVQGDRIKTEQIFINILSNSIKFTSKGNIQITYEEKVIDDMLNFQAKIADTGIGIPKDKLQEIFDRFIQVDNGLRKRHSGSGLGLAITKELVGLLKGDIQLSSEVGKGTVFTVSLSFPLAKPLPANTCEIDFTTLNLSHLRVLIVDDNKLNRMILSKILNKIGIESETAEGGIEALGLIKNKFYDLIFMDVHMPEIDGFEIVKMIRRENKETVILGLSADVTYEAIEEGMRSGMNDYLTKPIEQNKLFSILSSYFQRA